MITPDKMKWLENLQLGRGEHSSLEFGACAMEAAAFLADEEHTDAPFCACPFIAALMRSFNDLLPENRRTVLLKPLIPLTIGTAFRGDGEKRKQILERWFYNDVPRMTGLEVPDISNGRLIVVEAIRQLPRGGASTTTHIASISAVPLLLRVRGFAVEAFVYSYDLDEDAVDRSLVEAIKEMCAV